MARIVGVKLTSVQRNWKTHGLSPYRIRALKLSNDPKLVAKISNFVGVYANVPAHAVVISIDERSQIQAVD